MKNLHKKKVNLFGKKVSVLLIAVVAIMGLGAAALIPYFGQITGHVTVEQGLSVDGHAYDDLIQYSVKMTSLEEKDIVDAHNLINNAEVDAYVNLTTECSTTTNCNDITYGTYTSANDVIIKTADRLVDTQNNDGTWEWTNLDTNKTNTGASNTIGVTALGLIKAYELTGDEKYLDAAKITGDALVAKTPGQTNPNKFYSQDIEFLARLGQVTSESTYTNKAKAVMNYFMTQDNRYCATNGCTAEEMNSAYQGFYPTASGNEGYSEWQLASWVRAAEMTGNSAWSSDLASKMNAGVGTYFDLTSTSMDTYVLGLVGLTEAGNADAFSALIESQNSDGSWSDANGAIQDTAYAVMALDSTNKDSAMKGRIWLSAQSSNGVWLDDGTEYSEVNSEAIQAVPFSEAKNPIFVGAGKTVPFVVSSHFPKMLVPDTYTLTTTVTA
jgi:hypothetical protein